MRVDEEYLRAIVQYLNDPENVVAREAMESMRGQSPGHEAFYQEIYFLWTSSAEVHALDMLPVREATARLSARLKVHPRYTPPARQVSMWSWALRAAAVLAVGVGAWWWYTSTRVSYITRVTTVGMTDSVRLADASRIFLDANTTVRYPDRITGDARTVYLDRGNAFFSVSRDPERPFTVQLDGSSVTVLGTSFNIEATAEQVYVSVRTGTVRFTAGTAASILQAGDGAIYHRRTRTLQAVDATNRNADAWITHELRFVDASLQEVLTSLEDYYHVQISLKDSIANFRKFNASFRNNRLDEVLDVLAATYPIAVEHTEAHVVIRNLP
jgi:ferric-dicitrate binding protein FerR (iron transport regulator)